MKKCIFFTNVEKMKQINIAFCFTKIEQKLKKSKKTRFSRNFQKNRKKTFFAEFSKKSKKFHGIFKKIEKNTFFTGNLGQIKKNEKNEKKKQ